jgi:hypothetical protein
MESRAKSASLPKLTVMETFRGFEVCASCGVKYQWSPDGDCPNRCKSKDSEADDQQEKLIAAQAEYLVLLKKLEAIGYCGDELTAKARDIQAQMIAASFLPQPPPAPSVIPVTAGTIAKGVLIANLVITAIVLMLLLLAKMVS